MFTHLHLHTEYSLLDGLCKIGPLVEQAKALGMESLALTDHGALYGVIEFYAACQDAGIKPLIGVEAYLALGSRHSKEPAEKRPFHLTLLAKNLEGYQNLLLLTTKAHLEGFYHRPRMDKELLSQYSGGLVALSGCASGEIPRLLLEGRVEEARAAACWYREVFGDDFYLEVQEHNVPELQEINRRLLPLGRELDFPFVATNDVHFLHQEDHSIQDLLLCIQTNSNIHDEKRMRMSDASYYLKSPQEMADLFSHLPDAIANTQRIADRSELKLEFNKLRLPRFKTPPGKSPEDYLGEVAWEGARQRYGTVAEEMRRRLDYELEVIRETQFSDYFLVVWDIARYAREHGIFFGVRGSAAASLVLYCLQVTIIDPLAYGLVFERFLNVERKEMPDIDMDFQDDRRYEVINYVAQSYGTDHVAQIITFGTLKAKASIRDVGRALALPYPEVDRVARLIPIGPRVTLDGALQSNPELRNAYQSDQVITNLVDTARRLEGVVRNVGIHAAGVVISEEPLSTHLPLQFPKGESHGVLMTQFAMEDIARLGLLKMDFLGLDNFTILVRVSQILKQLRGLDVDFQQIPLDDSKTFDLLSSGETTGLFQLESAGMRRYIKELKPTSFNDIAAMIALYRPGPMEQIPTFIKAKHGFSPIALPHLTLAQILNETYGVIVYQDQVLLIAQAFAGYTLGEADVMRKAMGKKIPEIMRNERGKFLDGAVTKGFSKEVARQVWDLIEPFAGYAFNKAHSFSYGLITYWTAYIKAHFPVEYLLAAMNVRLGSEEKIAGAVAECTRLGIKVLPPDVSKSQAGFSMEECAESLDGRAIRFGLTAVKNVGEQAVRPLIEERERRGPFEHLGDFCQRGDLRDLNRRALESLVKAGAFDGLGGRGALLGNLEKLLTLAHREARRRESGQVSMFEGLGPGLEGALPSLELPGEEVSAEQRRSWEKELLGVYLTEHPLSDVSRALDRVVTTYSRQLEPELEGESVTLGGIITSIRPLITRNQSSFIVAKVEDLEGSIEVTVWPEIYTRTRELWKEGNIVVVQGRVRVREDQVSISCDTVRQLSEEKASAATGENPPSRERPTRGNQVSKTLLLDLQESEDPQRDVERLRKVLALLQASPGRDGVQLRVETGGTRKRLDLPDLSTGYTRELQGQLEALLGEAAVRVKEDG